MKILLTLLALFGLATAATADQRFEFSPFQIPEGGRIVVPVFEGGALSGIAAQVDQQTNGALSIAVAEAAFTGGTDSTLTLFGVSPYSRVDLIGVGAETIGRVAAENFGGNAAAALGDTAGGAVQILWPDENTDALATAARVAFGYRLRSYRFDRHQADKVSMDTLPIVRLLSNDRSNGSCRLFRLGCQNSR